MNSRWWTTVAVSMRLPCTAYCHSSIAVSLMRYPTNMAASSDAELPGCMQSPAYQLSA